MTVPNKNYANLKDSYLFFNISGKVAEFSALHPDNHLYRLGIGDVSLPLPQVVIKALHEAVDEQGKKATFHSYMPECGAPFLRKARAPVQ